MHTPVIHSILSLSLYFLFLEIMFNYFYFLGSDGSILHTDLIHQDATTGLIVPNSEAKMLLCGGEVVSIPPDHFIHPGTGRVLPIEGNVAYDPATSRLIVTVDSTGNRCFEVSLKTDHKMPSSKSAILR